MDVNKTISFLRENLEYLADKDIPWTYIVFGCFAIYVFLSVTFLLFPTLLHKKKKIKFSAQHISHRGGCGEFLENTLPAFQNAFSNNTDMFEVDVQLTKDGKVVVAHDDDLKRITGMEKKISECDYAELPDIKDTLELPLDAGASTNKGVSVTSNESDKKIPLLRTILERYPSVPLNVDTKKNDKVIDELIGLIREFKREKDIVIVNARSKVINIVHKKAPDLMIGISFKLAIVSLLSFWLGLLPFLRYKESFLQIEIPRGLFWRLLLPRVLFRHFQWRGLQIHFFTANEDSEFKDSFFGYGVDGVMTDFPSKLSTYLQSKPGLKKSKSN